MSPQETIDKITAANKIEDMLDVNNLKTEFNNIIKSIHPDVCSIPSAKDAIAKMNIWKDILEKGKQYKDDVGTFRTNGYWAEFSSDMPSLQWSAENYKRFMALKSSNDEHFKKYLPKEGVLTTDGTFKVTFDKRAIPLAGLVLPQEHVNWVLNRLLEYCAYLAEQGFSHCGINPESIFIVPETHGIQVCSFYHLTRFGTKIGTVSGRYASWYPQEMFVEKKAYPLIDIELSKRLSAYLLGDASGSGIKLRKTHNEDFVNFIVSHNTVSFEAMDTYKKLLAKNFKKEFHYLTI